MSMAEAKRLAAELGLTGSAAEIDDGKFLAEQFGMSGQPAAAPERDLEIIEGEILFYKRQAGSSIIEIGKRLNEAKAQLSHGEWLPWLREKVGISERSAQDFMRLAREYSKSAEIGDLGASKALALLALSPTEREGFVAEKHEVDGVEKSVQDMTAKELKRAIEERDAARRNMEAMKARAEVAEQSREKMEQDMRQLKELNRRAKETVEQKTEELAKAEGDRRSLKQQLSELLSKPVDVAVEVRDAAPEQIAEAKAAGAAEEAEKQAAALSAKEEQVKKLREDLKKAREEAKEANINLQTAEKEARAARDAADKAAKLAKVNSNENMVKFSVLFKTAQDTVNQMADTMSREAAENREKMRNAMNALSDAIRKAAGA